MRMDELAHKTKNIDQRSSNRKNKKSECNSIWNEINDSSKRVKLDSNLCSQIQNKSCNDITGFQDELTICRDCIFKDENESDNEECRFIGWRKLKEIDKDSFVSYGFLDVDDSDEKDKLVWDTYRTDAGQKSTDDYVKILKTIGSHFLKIIEREISFRDNFKKNRTWKRLLIHTRELCDQCSTTIFNSHMACELCGYSVCIDCYELRTRNLILNGGDKTQEQDKYNWYYCYKYNCKLDKTIKKEHTPSELTYVQFIPPHSCS